MPTEGVKVPAVQGVQFSLFLQESPGMAVIHGAEWLKHTDIEVGRGRGIIE